MQCVDAKIAFLNGQEYPAMIIDEGVISIDKPSRDYFASEKGIIGITFIAFIRKSFFSKILIDFFLKIIPPK